MLDHLTLTIEVDGEPKNLAGELEDIFYRELVAVDDGQISVASHLYSKYPNLNFDVLSSMFADNLGDRQQTIRDYLRWHRQRQPVFAPSAKANLMRPNVLDFACQIELMLRSEFFHSHLAASEQELLAALQDLVADDFGSDCPQEQFATQAVRLAALSSLLYERALNPALFEQGSI